MQQELLAGVAALETTGSWQPFGLLPTTPGPQWSFERRPDGTVGRAYCGGWRTITVAAAADLLVEWWPQLRRCAYDKCGVLFRPTHGRQHFHDPKCSALDRWFRLPKKKRDYKQELANANRRARRKTSRRRKTK